MTLPPELVEHVFTLAAEHLLDLDDVYITGLLLKNRWLVVNASHLFISAVKRHLRNIAVILNFEPRLRGSVAYAADTMMIYGYKLDSTRLRRATLIHQPVTVCGNMAT